MNDIITNDKEAKATIDEWGLLEEQAAAIKKQIEIKKLKVKAWAETNGVKRLKTDKYQFNYSVKGASIICETQAVTTADVVALLAKDKVGKTFIRQDYDTAAIKEYCAGIDNPDDFLEKFRLKFSKERITVEVKALKSK